MKKIFTVLLIVLFSVISLSTEAAPQSKHSIWKIFWRSKKNKITTTTAFYSFKYKVKHSQCPSLFK